MPRFSKHNDAVRYTHPAFTREQFERLCEALVKVSTATATAYTMPSAFRMITLDTIPNGSYVSEVKIPEEWRMKMNETVD
jgi:hypothetical protein